MAIYQFAHYDAFGNKDIQTFDTLDDIRWEIDRLEQYLDDHRSWRGKAWLGFLGFGVTEGASAPFCRISNDHEREG